MSVGNGGQGFAHVYVWIDSVQLAGLNERGRVRPSASAIIMTREARFLRLSAMGLMVFSTQLVSISTRQSVRKICRPSQWRWI